MCSREGVIVPLRFQCKNEMEGSLYLLRSRHDGEVVWHLLLVAAGENRLKRELVRFYSLKGGTGCGGEDSGGC